MGCRSFFPARGRILAVLPLLCVLHGCSCNQRARKRDRQKNDTPAIQSISLRILSDRDPTRYIEHRVYVTGDVEVSDNIQGEMRVHRQAAQLSKQDVVAYVDIALRLVQQVEPGEYGNNDASMELRVYGSNGSKLYRLSEKESRPPPPVLKKMVGLMSGFTAW